MKIRFYNRDADTNALKDAQNVQFLYIKRVDTDEIIVPSGTALNHYSEGIYEYDFVPVAFVAYEYKIQWTYNNITKDITSLIASTAANIYPIYMSLTEADVYFEQKLHSNLWFDSTGQDKIKSLISSTRMIDQLRFKSRKVNYDQLQEFPRLIYNPVPQPIKEANAELAYALIDGADPDLDYRNLRVTSRRYSSIGTTYDPNIVAPNVLAGIPSLTAWNLLLPYLVTLGSVQLHRVS